MKSSPGTQLDLFGHVERAEREARIADEQAAAQDVAYSDLVQTLTVTSTEAQAHGIYNTSGPVTVLVCPACGGWEPNEYHMEISHGIARHHLVQYPSGEWANDGMYLGRLWCVALELTVCHATYGDGYLQPDAVAMIAGLRPEVRARYEQEVAATRHRGPARS